MYTPVFLYKSGVFNGHVFLYYFEILHVHVYSRLFKLQMHPTRRGTPCNTISQRLIHDNAFTNHTGQTVACKYLNVRK